MNTFSEVWRKFRTGKKYREEFVASQVKRGIPFQIRSLMKKKGLSQDRLAELSGLTQGVVSRAANPNYGNLTLNTIIRIAAGFDVAFVGRFVLFSELGKWFTSLSEESVQVETFAEEDEAFEAAERERLEAFPRSRIPPHREETLVSLQKMIAGDYRRSHERESKIIPSRPNVEIKRKTELERSHEIAGNIAG